MHAALCELIKSLLKSFGSFIHVDAELMCKIKLYFSVTKEENIMLKRF